MNNHVKLSLSLDGIVHEGVRREAVHNYTDVPSVIQRVLSEHVATAGFLEDKESQQLRTFWQLVDQAVTRAEMICDRDGPTSDITAKACQECAEDADWRLRYEAYIGGPALGKGNPKKGKINREIGFRIRAALHAEVKKRPDGESESGTVREGIIQTYTVFIKVRGVTVF